MAATQNLNDLDSHFYLSADTFFPKHAAIGLTYDDITLATQFSKILPRDTMLDTCLADGLELHLPLISADMDTVTEHRMAIALALNGGLGLIHYNMSEKQQLKEVSRVKNHVHGLIQEPITVTPDLSVGDVLEIIEDRRYAFSAFPVVDDIGKLAGLLSGSVVKPRYAGRRVSDAAIPREKVHVVKQRELEKDSIKVADQFFTDHPGINKLLVVDDEDHLQGLFTLSDVERITQEAHAQLKPARDGDFQLLCGAAVSAARDKRGEFDHERTINHVGALVDRGVDAVAISTAHGHTQGVGGTVKLIRGAMPQLPIIAGNVTSASGVEYLADCGANSIKVGQGPGSICTTRIVAGVGIPQLTALYVASKGAKAKRVSIIADGGVTKSGDVVKALTLANAVIMGGLLAGCQESPGDIVEISGKRYKQYRGMGSLAAMRVGSAARYGYSDEDSARKIAAEGVEALKEVSGSVDQVLQQLTGGIQSGMGYLGANNLEALRKKARYIRISSASLHESKPHDVIEVKASS
jgi:IMP dehydrogenase|tara:strand:+ start:2125 stop:3693 length:1569 start_codon:yes stop_codon:yes gene_type:complete